MLGVNNSEQMANYMEEIEERSDGCGKGPTWFVLIRKKKNADRCDFTFRGHS